MSRKLTVDEIKKLNNMSSVDRKKFMNANFPITDTNKRIIDEEKNKLRYYHLIDIGVVGKVEKNIPYIYKDNEWTVDESNLINDRLIGYDGESIGTSTMFNIEEITEYEINDLIKTA